MEEISKAPVTEVEGFNILRRFSTLSHSSPFISGEYA
jgi:hypothetical protein